MTAAMMARTIDELCELAHEVYETAASAHGWETQERSRVAWADLPEENKAAMRAMMTVLRDEIRHEFRVEAMDQWERSL